MKKINHLITACVAVCLSNVSFAQNTWDGGTTSTITTNGSVGIGASPGVYRLNVTNASTASGISQSTTSAISGNQYGISNNLNNTNTSGTKYGLYNTVTNYSSGSSYGIYSTNVAQGTGQKYGIYSNVSGGGNGVGYGIYSSISGTSTVRYSIYSSVTNSGTRTSSTDATVFGFFSSALGGDSRSGYFRGDLEVNQGNTIHSSSNGNKTMFFESDVANDYRTAIVFNQTSNQYDWAWGKALELNRAGEMIKKIDGTGKVFSINRSDLSQDVFRIYGDGRVFSTELNVKLASAFPDYVFKSDYQLMPLNEVSDYIKSNGHLPNVPAAAEVEKEGINVGEMTTVLVEKVEELTLYLIEQQSFIKQQQVEIEKLKLELKKITK
ncbi:hypothetical protein [Fluviicola taffensis]|uniref:hypothetical protein n=1 Tax=Fluviicola taffensis TaxID=191579 RepID=UPI00313847B4